MKKAAFLFTFISLCLLAGSTPAASFPTASVIDGIGVCAGANASDAELNQLQSAGVHVIRTDFNWAAIESDPNHLGRYNYSTYDSFVSRCAAHNIKVYGVLDYGNELYDNSGYTTNDPGYYGTSAFRNAFTNYASTTARRYSMLYPGKVATWELWNEPNDISTEGGFWPGAGADPVGAATQYMTLANQLLPALRSNIFDSATIIAPAVSSFQGMVDPTGYLTTCFQQGLLTKIDGLSVHPYRSANPESAANAFSGPWVPGTSSVMDSSGLNYNALRSMMNYYGGSNIPIVAGEWGYTTTWSGITPQLQSNYLQRGMLVGFSQGIPLSIWFNDTDPPSRPDWEFGLFDVNGDPKPAYYGLQTLTRLLRGETFKTKLYDSHSDVWLLEFTGSGQDTLAAWTTNSNGRTVTVTGWGTLHLTDSPMFINPSTVPEPGTLVLLLAGLIGLPVYFWTRSRRAGIAANPGQ